MGLGRGTMALEFETGSTATHAQVGKMIRAVASKVGRGEAYAGVIRDASDAVVGWYQFTPTWKEGRKENRGRKPVKRTARKPTQRANTGRRMRNADGTFRSRRR